MSEAPYLFYLKDDETGETLGEMILPERPADDTDIEYNDKQYRVEMSYILDSKYRVGLLYLVERRSK